MCEEESIFSQIELSHAFLAQDVVIAYNEKEKLRMIVFSVDHSFHWFKSSDPVSFLDSKLKFEFSAIFNKSKEFKTRKIHQFVKK